MARTKKDSRRSGIWPLAYMGVEPVSPPLLITDNRAPTANDYKNFNVGTLWVNRDTAPIEEIWMLVNKDNNVARWIRVYTGSPLETLTGDFGGAVSPDSSANIDVLGSGPYLFTGTPASNLLTLSDDGTLATQYDADIGFAIPSGNVLQILGAGGGHITTRGATNIITVEVDGDIASSYVTDLGTAAPALGILNVLGGPSLNTSGAGNTVTVNIDGDVAFDYVTDSGTAVPAANILNVLGGELIGTTGAGNTVTANLDRGTDGQVIIAATGATSAYANITSTDTSVTIANGPNTVDLSVQNVDPPPFGYTNLGMSIDTGASTITIHSVNGSALSATNIAKITFPKTSVLGAYVTISLTANVSINWSVMNGNTMGTEGSKAWGNDMPLFVYAVINDAENDCTFGLGRVPHHQGSGVLANLGSPSSATADAERSLFLFESVTLGDYDNNPVVVLGSATAAKDASDQWTFSAIKPGTTGIGAFQVYSDFLLPPTQKGATNHLACTSGTVPIFAGGEVHYTMSPDGFMTFSWALNNLTNAGVGGATLYLIPPYSLGQGQANGGVAIVGAASVSNAALRGPYRVQPEASTLPWDGTAFVKIENTRLQPADFDTPSAANSQLTGSTAWLCEANQII